MIKIAISAAFMYPDSGRAVFGAKTLSYVESDLFAYVSKKGILPVLIPDVADDLMVDLVNEVDGFIFQGGSDLSPESYGESPIKNGRWKGDRTRDVYELKLMAHAENSGKPIMGVCRGMQLLNVYYGGSLYQDLSTQHPEATGHRNAEAYDRVKHAVTFQEGSALAAMYKEIQNPHVNSVHHQAIKSLAPGLRATAYSAPDKLVEAIEVRDKPHIFGVQWHPEFSHTLGSEVLPADRLFDYFLSLIHHSKTVD